MSKHKITHIPQLDGLRGIAILLVVSYHYFGFFTVFSFGWSGVDLFFVLSGFLITGKLLSLVNDNNYFYHFYRNRILRIFPLYYVILILFYSCILFLVKPEHLPNIIYYKEHWKSFFLFTQNWSFLFYGLPKDKYLIHFWSLALEEQFYLIWPLLIYFFSHSKWFTGFLISIFGLSLLLRCFFFTGDFSILTRQYFNLNTFCRMDSFAAGAIISYLHYSGINIKNIIINPLIYSSLIIILCSVFFFGTASFYENPLLHTFGFSLIAIFYAGILYKSIQQGKTTLVKILSAKWLRFFGRISYGLYIFHWLVSIILYQKIYDWGISHLSAGKMAMTFFTIATCIFLSIFISMVSFNYFEIYFLRLKKKTDA